MGARRFVVSVLACSLSIVSACSGDTVTPGSDAPLPDAAMVADAARLDAFTSIDASRDATSVDASAMDSFTPGVDAGTDACAPSRTCASQASDCGMIDDGCGTMIPCGTCTLPATCGGGGIAHVCGNASCTHHRTCSEAGATCGTIDDGCGRPIVCGGCAEPQACDATTRACAVPASCTNLCLQQVTCASPAVTTTISGRVYAPNGVDPLPNATVYVPNAAVLPFAPGVSCMRCADDVTGSPLVLVTTTADGSFTLRNMPVGTNIPLVIQLGRWRRQITIPNVMSCTNTMVPSGLTRLPRTRAEGDIPLMAFSTGSLDALECVMRKIGVADTEFTSAAGGGRIHLYEGLTDHTSQNATSASWASGGAIAAGSSSETQLWSTQAALNQYDAVFFPCQGDQANPTLRSAAVHQHLIDYLGAGGRMFATHFSYIWLYQSTPLSTTVSWNVEQHPSPSDQVAFVDTSFPRGVALAQWLMATGSSTTLGQIPLQVLRHDYDAVVAPSQSWLTVGDPVFPDASMQFTLNAPVGSPPASQCGRVLYNDYHVENTTYAASFGHVFPSECTAGAMTAQERLLEYMIFDLAACIAPDLPTCTARTCDDAMTTCGPQGDGCGGLLQCGTCGTGESCGGGGIPGHCGPSTCVPQTCADRGVACGDTGDGCGGTIHCGGCALGQTCGGGGPGQCGTGACTPRSCVDQHIGCGVIGDGCGLLLTCGTCPTATLCGGAGILDTCGTPACAPLTCADLGANCGPVGDGCGHVIQCGTCGAPQTCGGGGPSRCGGNGPTSR